MTKDIPAYAVVGGVPAKIIKYRFDREEKEKIENLKWWDWSEEKINRNVKFLRKETKDIIE